MASAPNLDFAELMPKVVELLFDAPNTRMSKGARLRFGNHGSMEIDVAEGWFDDHESNARGGVLELIQHKLGCNKHGALSWLEERGLKERRQADNDRQPIFYDYADADGVIAYRVERRGKHHVPPFLQHGPDGRGGFHAARGCMQGVTRLPYRLPELLAADPDAIVFIVEGEKDVDKLMAKRRDLPFVATTNSGGAGKFGADLASYFTGRRVVIIPDNDQPGKDHAEDVAAKLSAVASELVILTIPGGNKSDVSDWFSSGGVAHDLHLQAEKALAEIKVVPKLLSMLDPAEWVDVDTPAREWALDQWIPTRQATYLTGPGSAGKSLVTQQLCTCIALGIPFMGIETRQAVAIYITCEDDADELHRRQKAICAALGVRLADLSGKLHLVSLMGELGNELIEFDDRDRATPSPRFAETLATARHVGAGFVALDNVAHLTADEIARNKVAAFVNMLNRLARDTDGSVLFLGHPNKNGDPYSGSTAWENQVRSRIFLETPKDADGTPHDPDVRVLSRGKANYARNGETIRFRWHQWAFVRDEDLPANTIAEIGEVIAANTDNDAFLACLRQRTAEGEGRLVGPAPGPNYAPSQFEGMAAARGKNRRQLKKAMDRLFLIGAVEAHTYHNKAKSRDVTIIREVPPERRQPFPNPIPMSSRTDPERTPEVRPNGSRTTPHTLPYTTYNTGAPLGVGAPVNEADDAPLAMPSADADQSAVMPTAAERADVLRRLMTPLPDEEFDDD